MGDADPGWVGWFDVVSLSALLGVMVWLLSVVRSEAAGSPGPALDGGNAMRVFVAGASGAIGRPLIDRLLAGGHEVTALARTEAKAAALRERGVEPAIADALDAPALRAAVVAARPEVVVNELTALPTRFNPRKYAQALALTNQLRREAGPVLAQAAAEAGRAGSSRRASASCSIRRDPGSRTRTRRSTAIRRSRCARRSRR